MANHKGTRGRGLPIYPTDNGRWKVDMRAGGRGSRRLIRTFDLKKDAEKFCLGVMRKKQLGEFYDPDDVTLAEFFDTYWELHAVPNLSPAARSIYKSAWANHILPRLGGYELRQIKPGILTRFVADLKRAGVGAAMTQKAFVVLQSVLSFAVSEERLLYNVALQVDTPEYQREREPHVFVPPAVEAIRGDLDPLGATLVSLLAYSGPRPEEALRLRVRDVGEEAIFYDGHKTRRPRWTPLLTPLAQDLREWRLASGRRGPNTPLLPAHDGGHWAQDDWRNWRRRVWREVAPEGTRPRDLRSSYVTVQVYAGVPLTTIARWCGTSVAMLDKHYAGVIANWDGRQIPADEQIRQARHARQKEAR